MGLVVGSYVTGSVGEVVGYGVGMMHIHSSDVRLLVGCAIE